MLLLQSQIPLPNMTSIKLILLGDSGVGKTSLAHRYLHGAYKHDKLPATVSLTVKLNSWLTLQKQPILCKGFLCCLYCSSYSMHSVPVLTGVIP